MAGWFETVKEKHLKKENPAVVAFRAAIGRAIAAIEKGEKPNNRSLVKKAEGEWTIKLGKLDGVYVTATESEALKLLRDASFQADKDEDLLNEIEEAYGVDNGVKSATTETRKRGGGRPKGSKNKPKDDAEGAGTGTADAGNTEQAA